MAIKENLISRKKMFSRENDEDEDQEINEDNQEYSRYFKSGAILIFTCAILILLALFSYTDKDEINAISSVTEYTGLVSGDESIQIKAETTHNLLGLIGAKLAYSLYNLTVGYIIIFMPYFLIVFAKDLFKYYEIKTANWKRFGIFILSSILFASFMGSINASEIFGDISKEWYGNIGFFISSFSSQYIGSIGSILFFMAAIIITIVLGTNFNIDPILDYFVNTAEKSSIQLKEVVKSSSKDLKSKLETKYDEIKEKKKENKSVENNESNEEIIEEDLESDDDVDILKQVVNKERNESKIPRIIKSENSNSNVDINYEIKKKEIEEDKKKAFKLLLDDEEIKEESKFSDIQSKENNISNLNIDINKKVVKDGISSQIVPENEKIENNEESENNEEVNTQTSMFSSKINSLLSDIIDEDSLDSYTEVEDELDDAPVENGKKLVLDVEIHDYSDDKLDNPLSVLIHDEKINYISPGLDLLDNRQFDETVDEDELKLNAQILQEKLETFKIYIENLQITPGPVVTQYAFTPAAGIKISRIESLQDDLAMALKAKGIRIIAPIPGKGSVGIEIPNNNPSLVTFSSVINSKKFYDNNMALPIALGKNISGELIISDLAKMPHLLIAGTTGSGKSVGVNTIINSLLYKKSPNELKFAIVDPKKVELPQYSALKNHFLAISPDIKTPIVTDPSEAIVLLKSAVVEMEQRYDILAAAGQRNIADYNSKVREGKYKDSTDMVHRELPYIVVIVDEFADLILTAGKDVEEPIVRLAQMARAVGIHMIIATQRPSVDVITGIIKANFPSRIAFQVSSKVDSRTILDTSGAETLLGNGDMLFLPSGKPKPERVQNAYISTDEVENICDFIGKQKGYSQPYYLPSIQEDQESGLIAKEDRDPLFGDAARLIIATQQGSVSMLQRRLKIGYARAGRIIDELADAGVVGPFDGSKARLVLMESESDLEAIL